MYIQVYRIGVRYSLDSRTSEANLVARGFDFEFACLILAGTTLERLDDRKDYGESRVLAIGLAEGLHLIVAYTDRLPDGDSERRIISARRSNSRERKAYDQAVAKG